VYGEIPALRWNVPPLNESCIKVKVWETQSERRTGAADKAMFQLVEVQPCQLLVSDT
jgi:hypothetical protein